MSNRRLSILVGLMVLLGLVRWLYQPDPYGLPALGKVTGKVTLDGQPLTGAIVAFYPEKGRPATALIDEHGNYELKYVHEILGTMIGPATVHFAWPTGASGPTIPRKYDEDSDLKVEVLKGRNEFNFELDSKDDSSPASSPIRRGGGNAPRQKAVKKGAPEGKDPLD